MTYRYPVLAGALATMLVAAAVMAGQPPDQTDRLRQQLSQARAAEPDRDRTHQIDKALHAIGLRPGMVVAEVGAGPGYLVEKLARRVGPGGKVYAEDIVARMLDMVKIRMAEPRLTNCETVLGTETDPKLPAASLDMVLLHATMHWVESPVELFRNIVPSLKPGGRLVLIEPVQGQAADPSGRPIPGGGHRTREAFLDIFVKAGVVVERIDATTVPFDTIFVLRPASSGTIPIAAAAAGRGVRDSKIAEVPITVERNKVIVPVTAGGKVLRLILDTGHASDGILIFGSDRADTTAFGPEASAVIQGAGAGGGSAARLFEAASFDVGGVAFRGQRAIVLGGDTFKGSPTDGTIGHSLLGHHVVELDYDRGVMTLHDSSRFEPRPGWEAIPMSFKGNRIPWIEIAVAAAGEPLVRLAAYIDCASSETVELLTRDADKFKTPAVTRERYLGRGLSGDIHGREGTMARVRLGSYELTNVLVAVVPAAVRSKQVGADAVVANGLLRRFNVIYDYARQKLYIKPNAHFTGRVK